MTRTLLLLALVGCGSAHEPAANKPVENKPVASPCGCTTLACARQDPDVWWVEVSCEAMVRKCACKTQDCIAGVDRWYDDTQDAWRADVAAHPGAKLPDEHGGTPEQKKRFADNMLTAANCAARIQ